MKYLRRGMALRRKETARSGVWRIGKINAHKNRVLLCCGGRTLEAPIGYVKKHFEELFND